METFNRKEHWEKIYNTRKLEQFSWYQSSPDTSLNFFREFEVPLDAKIIDIGGGDSLLVDHLIKLGYQDISVLDISESAIQRAKERLGQLSEKVKWLQTDISNFEPLEQYDFWHDRAAFHFLTDEHEINRYIAIATKSIKTEGILAIGTFSNQGPQKCSGIVIKQYSENELTEKLSSNFSKIKCMTTDHITPSETIQHFLFCSFKK